MKRFFYLALITAVCWQCLPIRVEASDDSVPSATKLDSLKRAATASLCDAQLWSVYAKALSGAQRRNEAIQAYRKAVECDAKYTEAWVRLGLNLSILGRKEEALLAVNRALELEPRQPLAWYARPLLLSDLGRHTDALAGFEDILNVMPEDHRMMECKLQELQYLKRWKDALQVIDSLKTTDTLTATMWSDYCLCLAQTGTWTQALNKIDGYLQSDTANFALWECRGNMLCGLKRYKEAQDALTRAIELGEPSGTAYYRRAMTDLELDQTEAALKDLAEAIERNSIFRDQANLGGVFGKLKNNPQFIRLTTGK